MASLMYVFLGSSFALGQDSITALVSGTELALVPLGSEGRTWAWTSLVAIFGGLAAVTGQLIDF